MNAYVFLEACKEVDVVFVGQPQISTIKGKTGTAQSGMFQQLTPIHPWSKVVGYSNVRHHTASGSSTRDSLTPTMRFGPSSFYGVYMPGDHSGEELQH